MYFITFRKLIFQFFLYKKEETFVFTWVIWRPRFYASYVTMYYMRPLPHVFKNLGRYSNRSWWARKRIICGGWGSERRLEMNITCSAPTTTWADRFGSLMQKQALPKNSLGWNRLAEISRSTGHVSKPVAIYYGVCRWVR